MPEAIDTRSRIRFASVYRNFDGLEDFEAELRRLESEPLALPERLPISSATGGGDLPSDPDGSIASPVASATGQPGEFDAVRRGHAE